MTAKVNIIQFLADPFLGTSFPIGAFVQIGDRATFVESSRIPDEACVGGATKHALLVNSLRALRCSSGSAARLPSSSLRMMPPMRVPADVDPEAWAALILEGRPHTLRADPDAVPRHRESAREELGRNFFRQHQLDAVVRRTFRPGSSVAGVLEDAASLESVAQFVVGDRRLLLMEPIVPSRKDFIKDLREVSTRLAAYRHVLNARSREWDVQLLAFMLSGGPKARRDEALEALRPSAHRVFDVAQSAPRADLLSLVRDTAGTGSPQTPLVT